MSYEHLTDRFLIIAGPCAVESYEQLQKIAADVVKCGANVLRGGAFKPRTSPRSFQGLGMEGLKYLHEVGKALGVPIISELMDVRLLDQFVQMVDIIQIGSRNMNNSVLLKEVGSTKKPVMLKRGISATIAEYMSALEYISNGGNDSILLCERGIRTFENYTRNTFDISAIPALKQLTPYRVIADPSHGTGRRELVSPVAKAAVAAGADGIMVEVHHNPKEALCDGEQSLTLDAFCTLMNKLWPYIQLRDGVTPHEYVP